jgi:hypothetical protein
MDPVFQLQSDIYGRLMGHAWFSDVPVLLNEKGIIADDIENTLKVFTTKSGKKGAAVIVDRPLREVNSPNPSGPEFDVIIPISVFEMPLINRATGGTEKTIEEITSEVMHLLHGWRSSPSLGQVYCDKDAVTPVVGTDKIIVTEIQLRSRMRLESPARVATPTFSGNAAALQISCNTAGAAIYYTTDGSFPWSGNATAILHGYSLLTESGIIITTEEGNPLALANPFTVQAGSQVRSVAYKTTTHQASDCAAILF